MVLFSLFCSRWSFRNFSDVVDGKVAYILIILFSANNSHRQYYIQLLKNSTHKILANYVAVMSFVEKRVFTLKNIMVKKKYNFSKLQAY